MSLIIAQETATDTPFIDALVEEAFGPARKTRTVYQFRDGIDALPALGFVAKMEDEVVGSIRFWPVALPDGGMVPMLGPLAVRPELRGKGAGRALVRRGMEAAEMEGFPAVVIVGDPGYYAAFGFSVEPVHNLALPGSVTPLVFMGQEFIPGRLSDQGGVITPWRPGLAAANAP